MSLPTDHVADVGLLAPAWVGTVAEVLTSDRSVAEAMAAFEAALFGVRGQRGLVEPDLDPRALAEQAVGPGNPTLPLVAALQEAGGPSLHAGATSQDTVDTALMLVATAVLGEVDRRLVSLAACLAPLADEHRATPCVARTLTQQAMPTTLGFRVAGWLAGVHDALELVRGCLPLPVSLGGAVGTASGFGAAGPQVVEAVATALGLAAPVSSWHTRRTPVLVLGTALTAVGQSCGRICADLLLMGQTEVGEASEGSGGASSAMAHKANPTRLVLVTAATRQLPGLLSTLAASGAGASERPAGEWHAEWQPLRTMLRLAGAAAERTEQLAGDLRFDLAAVQRNLRLLVAVVGEDEEWVSAQTAHVGLWIDRVLARHEEACG